IQIRTMRRYFNRLTHAGFVAVIVVCSFANCFAQTRKEFLQPGEELVYKVKFGFFKLGTIVIQTGTFSPDGTVSAHMHLWSADIPFVHAKSNVSDQFYANDLTLHTFEEHSQFGDEHNDKYSTYDRATKTLLYADEKKLNVVEHNVEPYVDALGVLFNMRQWSGAVGHKYRFLIHTKGGVK